MLLLCTLLVCLPAMALGETVLFIHGHLGGPQNWRSTGIAARVVDAGWHDAGTLTLRRDKVVHHGSASGAAQRFVTVQLDGQVELSRQAAELERYVAWINEQFPRSPLILIGHSAGGLVARLYMVRKPGRNVAALVTIATPHRGTPLAELGELVGRSPLAWLAPFVGAGSELNDALSLYRDLAVEQAGNFLYALNHTPHPRARYISVVRSGARTRAGDDLLAPAWSQDMRGVAALRGQVHTVSDDGGHALSARDGPLVIRLLRWLQQA